jgi:D-beta-D-heptose 7-phosphate kinase/D-beta-D-heptose 1-phosphate adenosyltransferase
MAEKKVFTNGCFDILHRGHFELLAFCKNIGRVTVGINSDESVGRLKGNKRPINPIEDRVFALQSCKFVDEVFVFDSDTPLALIEQIRPDIIVKGGDYLPSQVIGNELAQVIIFPYKNGYSTTEIASQMGIQEV